MRPLLKDAEGLKAGRGQPLIYFPTHLTLSASTKGVRAVHAYHFVFGTYVLQYMSK